MKFELNTENRFSDKKWTVLLVTLILTIFNSICLISILCNGSHRGDRDFNPGIEQQIQMRGMIK